MPIYCQQAKLITPKNNPIFVSDEVYLSCFELELKMIKHLYELISKKHINYSAIIEELASNNDVVLHWCLVAADIGDETATQELLGEMVEL